MDDGENEGNDGGGTRERENHKKKDDGAVALHNRLPFEGEVEGEDAENYFAAVEGVDGDEIEDG